MTREILVLGAGPAGLAGAFWRLQSDPDARVTVVEAQARAGGWVRSEQVDGYTCEVGPQGIRPGDELDALVEALALGDELVPAAASAKRRYVARGGRLLPVPAGPGQFLGSKLFTVGGKLRLFKEPFVRRGDPTGESVTQFATRRFGAQTAPLVQTMVNGIFAGDADRLEVASAFPLLADCERAHGSVFKGMKAHLKARRAARGGGPRPKRAPLYTFRGGMSGLVARLGRELGGRLHLATPAQAVSRRGGRYAVALADGGELLADELVLAAPAHQSAKLLAALDPSLAAELGAIPFASLANVYLGYDCARAGADLPLSGFGFLLDPAERSPVLGVLYCSSLFPEHAPPGHGLLRVMIGGARHPETVDRSDDELVALATETVATYTGFAGPWAFRKVVRVRAAVPQYELGHAERLQRLEAHLQRHPGLSLRGNSYKVLALAGQLGRASGTDVAGASMAGVVGARAVHAAAAVG